LRNWKGTQSFQFATTTLPKSAQAGSRQAVRNAAHATQLRNRWERRAAHLASALLTPGARRPLQQSA
jgi:hypothetical protein